MAKAANILLALFLALAPGMNAVRLLHGLHLCAFAGGGQAHLHEKDGHRHGDPCQDSDRHPPQDECPHLKNISQGATALVFEAPLPFDLPAPPLASAPALVVRPRGTTCPPAHLVRPPPGPPRLGCVLLQV